MRAAKQSDQVLLKAVDIEARAFILGDILLERGLRLGRHIGRGWLGGLRRWRLDRGGLDAELV